MGMGKGHPDKRPKAIHFDFATSDSKLGEVYLKRALESKDFCRWCPVKVYAAICYNRLNGTTLNQKALRYLRHHKHAVANMSRVQCPDILTTTDVDEETNLSLKEMILSLRSRSDPAIPLFVAAEPDFQKGTSTTYFWCVRWRPRQPTS